MSEALKIVVIQDPTTAAAPLVKELTRAGVAPETSSIRAAYIRCKDKHVNAVLFFAKPTDNETVFDPILKRISRDCPRTFIYVVAPNVDQRLKLISDDHVQAVFAQLPPVEGLLTVIQRAADIRKEQHGRNTPRYPVRYGCMVKMIGSSGVVEGEVRQLGRGGFTVSLKTLPARKTEHDPLRFTIFRKVGASVTRIEGDGEVTWGDPEMLESGIIRLGVRFSKLDGRSEGHLLACINTLRTTVTDSASPARA